MQIKNANLSFGHMSYGNNPHSIVFHHAEKNSCSVYDVHSWHKDNGWAGIGYHYFIKKNGEIWKGRPDNVIGAHVSGFNNDSLGVCAEGSYMKETMPQAQKNAIIQLGKYLCDKYGITKLYGHREVGESNCPGSKYPLNEIRNAILRGGNSSVTPSNPSSSKPIAVVSTPNGVNVRFEKSNSSKILGTLANGQSVNIYKVEDDWVHIYYPPNGGYVSKQYVKLYNIPKEEESEVENLICYRYDDLSQNAAEYLGDFLKCATIESHRPYNFKDVKNVFGIGGTRSSYTSYLDTLITEKTDNNVFERTIGYITTKLNIKWEVTKYNIPAQEKEAKNILVTYNNYVDKRSAEYLATHLNSNLREMKDINVNDYDFIYLIGAGELKGDNVRVIKGKDRYITAKEVIDFMKFR